MTGSAENCWVSVPLLLLLLSSHGNDGAMTSCYITMRMMTTTILINEASRHISTLISCSVTLFRLLNKFTVSIEHAGPPFFTHQ